MTEGKIQAKPSHEIILTSREKMSVDGVRDVISFDEGQVTLVTACGELVVEGKGLHVGVLNLQSGRVELDGEIDELFYVCEKDPSEKRRGFFGRIFG